MKTLTSTTINFLIILLLSCTAYAKTTTILVQPFQYTGDQKSSWVSAGMTATVMSNLAKMEGVTIIPETNRKKTAKDMESALSGLSDEEKALRIGKVLGANIICTGSCLVKENQIQVNSILINVEKPEIKKDMKFDGTLDKIFDLQDRVVIALMSETVKIQSVGKKPVKATEEDRKKIEQKEKPSLSAYELYSKGYAIQQTDPRGAMNYFRQAISLQPDYIDALMDAAFISGNTLNLYDEALGYLTKAEKIFTKKGEQNTEKYADIMNYIGIVNNNKGENAKALEFYMKSKEIYNRLGLQKTYGYAPLMNNIGCAYNDIGEFDKALEFFIKSNEIKEKLGFQNTNTYAITMMNIGEVYTSKGKLDKALKFFIKSKETLDGLGLQNTPNFAFLMNDFGKVHKNKGEFDKALEFSMKSKEIYYKLGLQNTAEYASVMNNIGSIYKNKGELDKALEFHNKSKEIYDRLGLQNTAGYAEMQESIADLYETQGNKVQAGEYFRKAYNTYVKAGYKGEKKDKALKNAERLGK